MLTRHVGDLISVKLHTSCDFVYAFSFRLFVVYFSVSLVHYHVEGCEQFVNKGR
jgi:hypothetical protein